MVFLSAGCPTQVGPPPTVAPADSTPVSLGDDVFVHATGRGTTEDEAYAAARVALAEALLGDASWASVVSLDVHRRGEDPQRAAPTSDGMEVVIGLSRSRAAAMISDFENGEVEVHGPPVWHDTLNVHLRAHVAAHACVRRNMLFQVRCETGETGQADAAVAELAQGLLLVSAYPDGIPVDSEGQPLRTPVVFALWRGTPLAGLPVLIETVREGAVAEPHVVSDAQGRIHVALSEGPAFPSLQVIIDAEALMGPLRDSGPQTELPIEPRTVGLRRWALLVAGPGSTKKGDRAAAVLRSRMDTAGLGAPVELNPRDAKTLRATSPGQRGTRLTTIADMMSGRIDLLFVLSYRTRFASRMAGGRIWYEAEGTLQALDAWTGLVRAEATMTVGADGVGDDGADAAARDKLGQALSKTVIDALKP